MPSALDTLIGRIADEQLRADIRAAVSELRKVTDFGLVFESHIPETVALPNHAIRRGLKVAFRDVGDHSMFEVVSVNKSAATIRRLRNPDGSAISRRETPDLEPQTVDSSALVALAEFGDTVYPGLRHIGGLQRGADRPAHVVIKGENHHVLEALQFSHAGGVDCIYIDPPYNSGARDWKYNNNYVDEDDGYRHSKWLAFMNRRLLLAKRLLNPDDSVLLVTIDEKEYLRLGLLLQQIFPNATMQMVSTLINPKGTGRVNELRRVDEYLFLLWFGKATVGRLAVVGQTTGEDADAAGANAGDTEEDASDLAGDNEKDAAGAQGAGLDWQTFRRRDLASRRGTKKGGPAQFYPIYVNEGTGRIEALGVPLPHTTPAEQAPSRPGCVAVFPVRPDGTEMNWALTVPTAEDRWRKGFLRAGKPRPTEPQKYVIQYLKSGSIADIEPPWDRWRLQNLERMEPCQSPSTPPSAGTRLSSASGRSGWSRKPSSSLASATAS